MTILVRLCLFCSAAVLLPGCTEPVPEGLERVVIQGETFHLEPALDNVTRTKGLGDRAEIPADGGMIFAFPGPRTLTFVMRDCLVPIDIAYCADNGRIVALHEMAVEPRLDDESDFAYEMRLTKYSSGYPVRFAIEVRGGTWDRLNVQKGDILEFDADDLKARAR